MSDYLASLGTRSKTTILAIEDGKLSLEFEADEAVKCGQPVKLTADGKVALWLKTDALNLLIGHVYNDGAEGELVTVFMRSHLLIYALAAAAQDTDTPKTIGTYNTANSPADGGEMADTKGWNVYANPGGGEIACAWQLDPSDEAWDLVRVAVFH